MKITIITKSLAFSFMTLAMLGCWPDTPMKPIFESGNTTVVVLKMGATDKGNVRFIERYIALPGSGGGTTHPEGLRALGGSEADGHPAILLSWRAEATSEQKEAVYRRLRESPDLVDIFEDTDAQSVRLTAEQKRQ
jgi:hypothetical protein